MEEEEAAINLKADQTISGTAINMLAPGLGLFLAKLIFNGNSSNSCLITNSNFRTYLI